MPVIQGLDAAGRVLYVGTFTKVLYPSLRLAYLVLAFVNARTQIDGHGAAGLDPPNGRRWAKAHRSTLVQ